MEMQVSQAYRQLVQATGTPGLERTLLAAVNQFLAADEVVAFERNGDAAGDWLIQSAAQEIRVDRQSPDHWRFRASDPLTARLLDPAAPAFFIQKLRAREISDSAYRQVCYERCNYSERVSVCLRRDARWYVMNVYRDRARPDAPSNAIAPLCELVELAIPLLELHRRLLPQGTPAGLAEVDALKRRLQQRYPALADRELEVCALTISGFSAKAIARTLDVAPATVMTYRRRAYAKLGITAAGSLVPSLLI